MKGKKKLILLTTAILRGETFHIESIGEFYKLYNKYFLLNYEVYHIINIDEPSHLKKYFNYYESILGFENVIPNNIKKIYLKQEKAGFLGAYKNLMNCVIEKNLDSNENLFWWLEDDWKPKKVYDFYKFINIFSRLNNTAFTLSQSAALCSFRGGPIMSGTFFKNLFNCSQFMNNTCDPERQVNRWVRYNETGSLNRIKYDNGKVDNTQIQLFLVYIENDTIDLNKFLSWSYNRYNPTIKLQHNLLVIKNNYTKFHYSKVKYPFRNDNYNLKKIAVEKLLEMFNNNCIKYFHVMPMIFFNSSDIGRKFNEKYGLRKWMRPGDMTGYQVDTYNDANLGNWKGYNIEKIRLSNGTTYNSNFFEGISIIMQVYPYLKNNYYDKKIKLNLNYNSHTNGSYPNFNIIGDLLKLNYNPTLKAIGLNFDELRDIPKIYRKLCGDQRAVDISSVNNFYSFKNNFSLVSKIFNTLFKFDESILNEVNNYVKNNFENNNVLGVHYISERSGGIQNITIEQFITIIEYELSQQSYKKLFVVSDRMEPIEKIKERFKNEIKVIHYLKENYPSDNQRYKDIVLTVKKLKNTKGLYDIVKLEKQLKEKGKINRMVLKNYLINCLLLSKCNLVLKTCSQLSAYSKILNPNLRIYRVNGSAHALWPDSFITLYSDTNIRSQVVRKILRRCANREFKKSIKIKYLDLLL